MLLLIVILKLMCTVVMKRVCITIIIEYIVLSRYQSVALESLKRFDIRADKTYYLADALMLAYNLDEQKRYEACFDYRQ